MAERQRKLPLQTRIRNRLFEIDGQERRRQSPYDVPLPLDERGPKQERITRNIPEFTSVIPVVGLFVDIARFSEVGYHLGSGIVKGDRLRMPEAARNLPPEQKEQYLKEYLLNRFDRTNRIAKAEYHRKRGIRYARRAGVNALGAAASVTFLDGGLSAVGAGFFGSNAAKELLMAGREFHERRLINKRAGKVKKGRYDDPEFRVQIAEAVRMIGISDDPTQQAEITERLYRELDPIRSEKRKAFHQLTWSNRRQIKRAARQLERLDYLSDYHMRLFARRAIKRMGGIEKLRELRNNIRTNDVFVYDPTRKAYILAGALGGVQA